jgi:8-oxo-dGTP pyrophosphatase MutT (NUDIX family)
VWATCDEGHRHWGPQGAAGLLLARDGAALLQLRAAWVHRGGTWSVPGGARERGESATAAALREAHEELGVDAGSLVVEGSHVALCGGWTYETVLAHPAGSLADLSVRDRSESDGHRWVPADDVAAMPLHPAFRRAREDAGSGLESFVRRA